MSSTTANKRRDVEVPAFEKATFSKVARKLMPFLVLCYLINFLDRTNVGYAATLMEKDIGLGVYAYGLGAGIFFIAYFIFEVPSNIALHKIGARIWICRIMVSWGLVAGLMAFITTPWQFFALRFLLGAAEAGLFPGVLYFLTLWFPVRYRARLTGIFFLGIPLASVIGSPISTGLIVLGNTVGITGWRLMYFVEALPALIFGVACLFVLKDSPRKAPWLSDTEKDYIEAELAKDAATARNADQHEKGAIMAALKMPIVWVFALIYFGLTAGSNTLNFFLPQVIEAIQKSLGLGTDIMTTGFIVAIPYAFAAVAMVFWSRHSDQTRERRLHVAVPAIIAALTTIITLALNNPFATVIGFCVMAAGIYGAQSVVWSVPQQMLVGMGGAVALGLINSIGNLSGFVGPYLTGWIKSATQSNQLAFSVIACFVLAAGITALFAIDNKKVTGAAVATTELPTDTELVETASRT